MVHISEVATTYVNDIKEHLTEGQTVKVKILSIGDDGKISLSIKKALPQQSKPSNRPERGRSQKPQTARPGSFEGQQSKKSENSSFEDMLSKFKQASDEKMSDLKKTETRRNGYSRRSNSQKN